MMQGEVLNISPIVVWVIALSQLLTFGLTVWGLLSSGSRDNARRIEEHQRNLASHDQRLIAVETAVREFPTRSDLHGLDVRLTRLQGSMDVLNERLRPLEAITERMQELLIERGHK